MNQKQKTFLLLFLVVIVAYRLLLIGAGQRYWPDEYRYLHAMHLIDELSKGNLQGGLNWVFGTTFDVAARPGFMFFAIIPALMQGVGHLLFEIGPSDALFYRIPAIFNVAVSVGVALLFYRVALLLVKDHALALLGLVSYGLLTNTNLYVRHLFPYDWSLLLLLAALNLILSDETFLSSPHYKAILAGLLAGLGVTTYTPYWPMVIILVAAMVASRNSGWHNAPAFINALLSIVIMWEAIARIGGLSYIGRFTEAMVDALVVTVWDVKGALGGPIFLPFYSLRVEGLAGVMLLALFLYFWFGVARRRYGRVEVGVIGAASAVYIVYGSIGIFTHNHIFYFGRLIHMYFPFLVFGAILGLKGIAQKGLRIGVAMAMMASVVVSFVPTATRALAISYPRDIERDLVASMAPGGGRTCTQLVDDKDKDEKVAIECDLGNASALVVRHSPSNGIGSAASVANQTVFCNRVKDSTGQIQEPARHCNFVLENFRHVFPTSLAIVDAAPPSGFTLSAVYEHPLQFDPYWFEDFPPEARNYYAGHPVQMRVYKRTGPVDKLLSLTDQTLESSSSPR
jgi:hypothetical protein